MKRLNVYKSQRMHDRQRDPTHSATLIIDQEIPDFETLEGSRRVFENQAHDIVELLGSALPGGTMHALLIELLRRKECLLVVKDEPARRDPGDAPTMLAIAAEITRLRESAVDCCPNCESTQITQETRGSMHCASCNRSFLY